MTENVGGVLETVNFSSPVSLNLQEYLKMAKSKTGILFGSYEQEPAERWMRERLTPPLRRERVVPRKCDTYGIPAQRFEQ